MSRLYVYREIGKLSRRYGTRDPFELLDALEAKNEVKAPKGLTMLKDAKVLHETCCEKDGMENVVFDFAKG